MQGYLPLLSEVLLEGKMIHAPVRAVIRKGKRHYACDYRLERRMRETVHMRSSRRRQAALWSLKEDMLILPKLPFAVPDELRKRQQEEYDTLQDYIRTVVVPEMQIKLRQGFGRAIRTETGTCVVAILDDRSVTGGRYHQAMLDALPEMPVTSDMLDVAMFYLEKKPAEYFREGSRDEP